MSEFISHRCHDTECECYGKALVWIPVLFESEPVNYRLVCPSEIQTQSVYNLKYESKAQMEEEDE